MSQYVQITLIICMTIIISQIINCFKNNNADDERVTRCKSPTYTAPPRPGQGYQPKHDNSKLEIMRKPPKTGSGIE